MKLKQLLSTFVFGLGLAYAPDTFADDKLWTATTGDFLNPANWNGGLPGGTDVAIINNGGTATIPDTAGVLNLSSVILGDSGAESGHIVMNGGTLHLGMNSGDPKPIIGNGTTQSSFIMNGGTIFLDGPDQGGQQEGFHGVSELDWEVGEKGLGRFEMHGDSKFYASDDLKGSDSGGGTSEIIIDGNAFVAVGSGVSVSGGADSRSTMTIGGNARVDAGNSMGAGHAQGGTDEGYLTMASGNGIGTLTIQDNGILNIRRLSAREGESTIIVKNHGQFHIFDVLTGAGTNAASRPPVTGPNSTFASAGTGTFILQDDAQMTVNAATESTPVEGLAIAGPRDTGNPGGVATFRIQDRASFRVEQDLGIANGYNGTVNQGTLEIVGPNAQVSIGRNLNLAVNTAGEVVGMDADGNPAPGKAIFSAGITGSSHSIVNVTGTARIANGHLKVKLDGYAPAVGNSYTLIKGGTIDGQFASTDFSEAALADGLGWDVEYTADSVVLRVVEQAGLPKSPQAGGATPRGATVYVNTPDTVNNGNTESLGVALLGNGNIVVGWEDDAEEDTSLEYLGSVWTMLDPLGNPLTPPTAQTSTALGGAVTNRFLSYFRADGSAIPGFTSWGPKIKANLFGEGFGMGATSYALNYEVPEFTTIQNNAAGENAGDFPSVQLVGNSGQPIRILSGLDEVYAEREGDVRIGDWDFLSNGNVVIAGENRQRDDLVELYGGDAPGIHAVYRILTPDGTEIKQVTLASEIPLSNEIWHGIGVTSNGFAIRMGVGGRGTIRLFNNDGTPASTNIDLAERTGFEINAGGGRGDSIGFHGNGKDAYVLAVGGTDADGSPAVWVSVLNADGSLRYSKKASDDVAILSPGRVDAAIDDLGRVLVAYDAALPFDDGSATVVNPRIVMARLFDPSGNPLGGTFYVSEKELPAVGTPESRRPRVAFRNGVAVVAWESLSGGSANRTVAVRTFNIGGISGGDLMVEIERAGANSLRLTWEGGSGPYLVQRKSSVTDANWMNVGTTSESSMVVPNDGTTGFFRVQSGATNNVQAMSIVLSSAFEPGTVTSAGTGRGTISLEGNKLSFDIKYRELSGPGSNAHIHGYTNTAGNAGVLIDLAPYNGGSYGVSGRIAGSVELSEAQRAGLLAGDTYVNIHTGANPGGEIRGQIIPARLTATLNGAQETPTPVDTPATGTGTFTLVSDELFVDLTYTGLKQPISNAHIHGPGAPGEGAGVLVQMMPLHTGTVNTSTSAGFQGSVTLDATTLKHLIDGLTYFNIHSAAHGGGEIRGQIVP